MLPMKYDRSRMVRKRYGGEKDGHGRSILKVGWPWMKFLKAGWTGRGMIGINWTRVFNVNREDVKAKQDAEDKK